MSVICQFAELGGYLTSQLSCAMAPYSHLLHPPHLPPPPLVSPSPPAPTSGLQMSLPPQEVVIDIDSVVRDIDWCHEPQLLQGGEGNQQGDIQGVSKKGL